MAYNRSAARTIEMLSIISKQNRGISLVEIAKKLDIPKTSAFDILHTLLKLRVVDEIQDGHKKYIIGYKAYEIGNSFLSNTNLINESKPVLAKLGDVLQKTIFLAIQDGNEVVYIYKHEPFGALVTTCQLGTRNHMHSTSLGKSILAYTPPKELRELIGKLDMVEKTKYTITNPQVLIRELGITRDRGYALDDREAEENLFCIGAPIFDHTGKAIASISASGFYRKNIDVDYESSAVKTAAATISSRLGYKKNA